MAQTIYAFYSLGNTASDPFIIHWMKEFGIGADYEVEPYEGEAYKVRIISDDGTSCSLADKGIGSIKIMFLLFHMSTLKEKLHRHNKILFIEEPEQNLHPKLQSKLTDLFKDFHEKYGCTLVVETHSEYLIRKTQVMVKEARYASQEELEKESPFKVYYINGGDSNEPYYKMNYRTDGQFSNEFGKGFFDESTSLLFDIL